jgi:hypothetical protein
MVIALSKEIEIPDLQGQPAWQCECDRFVRHQNEKHKSSSDVFNFWLRIIQVPEFFLFFR